MTIKITKKKLTKIKVPRTIKDSDLKLYLSFCMGHVKETDTPEKIEKMWKEFKKSLKDAVKSIKGEKGNGSKRSDSGRANVGKTRKST